MAVKRFAGDKFTGLSTDTKPTNLLAGATYIEIDSRRYFVFDGAAWQPAPYIDNTQVTSLIQALVSTAGQTGDYNDLLNLPDLSALNQYIEQYADLTALQAITGENNVLYITLDTGFLYRWNGSGYTQLTDQTAVWGSISGVLSNQTDLQAALNAKEAVITAGTVSQYLRGDKTWQTLNKAAVGLANVDNTSDANKPISTAAQTALNGKVNTADKATTAEAEAGTNDTKWMTPLKTKQAIDEFAGAAGEVNTASNVGTGAGVYKEKVGTDIRLKSLKAGSNISLDTTNPDEIEINADGAAVAGAAGDVQFNDGANGLGASSLVNVNTTSKRLLVPDLKIKETDQNNVAADNTEAVYKVTTEVIGPDTVVRILANIGSGEDVIIASYIV